MSTARAQLTVVDDKNPTNLALNYGDTSGKLTQCGISYCNVLNHLVPCLDKKSAYTCKHTTVLKDI